MSAFDSASLPSPMHIAAQHVAGHVSFDFDVQRVARLPWTDIAQQLDQRGHALLPALLNWEECAALAAVYRRAELFRSRVLMARHGFGRGEYQYFSYPLPAPVQDLRASFYPHLAPLDNRWHALMNLPARFPDSHPEFIRRCHAAGQLRPTPLLLEYRADDYNCLHQDLYGEQVFPLQMVILLSQPGEDFEGGEFVLSEQRPRLQSRAEVLPLQRGDAVIFAVSQRPVNGSRGSHRVNLRHGVSRVRSGLRYTLGVIFHDAL